MDHLNYLDSGNKVNRNNTNHNNSQMFGNALQKEFVVEMLIDVDMLKKTLEQKKRQ
jgi:hypothetical protein